MRGWDDGGRGGGGKMGIEGDGDRRGWRGELTVMERGGGEMEGDRGRGDGGGEGGGMEGSGDGGEGGFPGDLIASLLIGGCG